MPASRAARHLALGCPDQVRAQLDRGRGRDASSLPGDGPDGHHRPAGHSTWRREAGGRLPETGAREGRHSGRAVRPRGEPAERRRAPEGQRQEEAAADPGPHRHGERGREEVDLSAVQRRAQGRLHLRARHGGRQGQPRRRADDDAAAEAQQRGARSRRHLPGGRRRGRRHAHRHPVHGQPALRRDRRGVLLCRRRQRRRAWVAR